LFVVFKDSGQADKYATCFPDAFFIDKCLPNLEKTLDAVRNLSLSARVSAHPFLYMSIILQRSERWLQQL
jgi:hypothetical protein